MLIEMFIRDDTPHPVVECTVFNELTNLRPFLVGAA
jgi:hypothetical protein